MHGLSKHLLFGLGLFMRLDSNGGVTGLEGSRCPHSHVWKLALLLANITSVTFSWPKQVTRPGFIQGAEKKALSLGVRNGKVTLQRGRRISMRGKQPTTFWKTILNFAEVLFIFIPGKCFLLTQKYFACLKVKVFFSRSFITFIFMFRFYELPWIFVYCVKKRLKLDFFHIESNWSNTVCWKDCPSLIQLTCQLCQKSDCLYVCRPTSWLSIHFHWSICLSSCQYHTVLIIVVL